MRKIIITIVISLTLLMGGILFIVKDTKINTLPKRSYILVEVKSDKGYPFPLALPPGKTAKEIVVLFEPNYHHIFRRTKGKWIELDDSQKIYSDIKMKVT